MIPSISRSTACARAVAEFPISTIERSEFILATSEKSLSLGMPHLVMQINSALARMNAAVLGSFEMVLFNLLL